MTTPLSPKNTPAFFAQAAISFGVAVVAVGIGITYLPVDRWIRGFLAIGALFLISSAFTLAKCVRDHQEETSVLSRVDQARLEKLLADHDPFRVDPPV
ncbi:MAG: YiaA/YiaB family inner membrane protein [Actinomycetes bacterium]